jgi:hypothetical protein
LWYVIIICFSFASGYYSWNNFQTHGIGVNLAVLRQHQKGVTLH